MAHIDREKHDIDVMERVLGHVREDEGEARSEVIDVDVRPWLGGVTTSTVQMTVGGVRRPRDPRSS